MNPATVITLVILVTLVSYVIGRLQGRYIHAGIPLNMCYGWWKGDEPFQVGEDKTPDSVKKIYSVRFKNDSEYRLIRFTSTSGSNPLVSGQWYCISQGSDQQPVCLDSFKTLSMTPTTPED